jgi:uncharacterized protein (DUF983 family)
MHDGTTHQDPASHSREEREIRPALIRGWRRRCPHCGQGPLMKSYLAVRASCPVCGEALHHHRADDGPAYLTILIVGHVMARAPDGPSFVNFRPEPMVLVLDLRGGVRRAVAVSVAAAEGRASIGYQWAKRMHGFGGAILTAD